MTGRVISVLKYIGSLSLAGTLLYFAFRNVEWQDFYEKAQTVDYTWVIFSIILSCLAYVARAYRWNILLKPAGYTHLSTWRTTLAIVIGYLANLAFPRLGEITRCGVLKRSDDVPVSSGLGTVISERVIDVLTLLLLMFITLILEYDRLISFFRKIFELKPEESLLKVVQDPDLLFKLAIALGIGLLIVGLMVILARRAGGKVKAFIRELYEGVISLKNIDNLAGFIISTLVLWVTYYFMSYIIIFSLPETAHLGWMVGVMLLVTGGIALAIPVQGGFGTYHTMISAMLALYAVEKTTGVFLATLLHTSQVVAIALFGGVALLITFFTKRKAIKNVKQEATAER